jgi:LPS sulfotransferase NodH
MTDFYVRFIVLGQGRTGSTMLVQALDSHPAILCFGEIFNASTPSISFGVPGYDRTPGADLELRARDPQRFLRERIFCDHGPAVRAVGFKFHYDHFWRHEGLIDILVADRGLKIVHLLRRNRLRTFVSLKIAEATGQWFEFPPEPPLASRLKPSTLTKALRDPKRALAAIRRRLDDGPAPPAERASPSRPAIMVDEEEFREYCRRGAYSEVRWEELMQAHEILRISYEDLVSDRDVKVAQVQQFLGLDPAPTEVSLRKQNPEPLRELISNYDELRLAFAGSLEEAFFDD